MSGDLGHIAAADWNEHRDNSQYPERDREMFAGVHRGFKARETCHHDIVESQIRIALSMPYIGGKDEQE